MNRKSLNFKIEKSKIQIVNEYLKSKSFVSNQAHLKIKKSVKTCVHMRSHTSHRLFYFQTSLVAHKNFTLQISIYYLDFTFFLFRSLDFFYSLLGIIKKSSIKFVCATCVTSSGMLLQTNPLSLFSNPVGKKYKIYLTILLSLTNN